MQKNNKDLQINSLTWKKDTFELIDYENQNFIHSSLIIKENGFIYRKDSRIYYYKEYDLDPATSKLLDINYSDSSIQIKTNKFTQDKPEEINNSNCGWLVYKKIKQLQESNFQWPKQYKLNEGDIIKMGRAILQVKKIKVTNNYKINPTSTNSNKNISFLNKTSELNKSIKSNKNHNEDEIFNIPNNINIINNSISPNNNNDIGIIDQQNLQSKSFNIVSNLNKLDLNPSLSPTIVPTKNTIHNLNHKPKVKRKICRICYNDSSSLYNPLIRPCQCSGTMKYIHLTCLRHWINTKMQVENDYISSNNPCSSYIINHIECELCKAKLKSNFTYKKMHFSLFDFDSQYDNYLTLESINLDKDQNQYLHVISFDKANVIKIGRSHEADLRLNEISVSRIHCIIHCDNQKNIYISDNDSKFGTLVLIQAPFLNVDERVPFNIQVGRTFINGFIKQTRGFFMCCKEVCCRDEEGGDDYCYGKQNEKYVIMLNGENKGKKDTGMIDEEGMYKDEECIDSVDSDSIDCSGDEGEDSKFNNSKIANSVGEEKNDGYLKIVNINSGIKQNVVGYNKTVFVDEEEDINKINKDNINLNLNDENINERKIKKNKRMCSDDMDNNNMAMPISRRYKSNAVNYNKQNMKDNKISMISNNNDRNETNNIINTIYIHVQKGSQEENNMG